MPSDASKIKPGKSKASKAGADSRRSRSRNTTPVSASARLASEPPSLYFSTPITQLQNAVQTNLEKVLGSDGGLAHVPSSVRLNLMQDEIKNDVLSPVRSRGEVLDRVMRELSKKRKERAEQERDRERVHRETEERRHKLKKHSKKQDPAAEERPLAVGAHEVARQDGVDAHKGKSCRPRCRPAPTFTSRTLHGASVHNRFSDVNFGGRKVAARVKSWIRSVLKDAPLKRRKTMHCVRPRQFGAQCIRAP